MSQLTVQESRIGLGLSRYRARAIAACVAVGLAIAWDLSFERSFWGGWGRIGPAALGFVSLLIATGFSTTDLGLRLTWTGSLRAWIRRATVLLYVGIIWALLVVVLSDANVVGQAQVALHFWPNSLEVYVLQEPIFQETLYCLALVPAVRAVAGPKAAIVASGTCWSLYEVLEAGTFPLAFVPGCAMAWIYLKSESAFAPLLFHFVGALLFLLYAFLIGW